MRREIVLSQKVAQQLNLSRVQSENFRHWLAGHSRDKIAKARKRTPATIKREIYGLHSAGKYTPGLVDLLLNLPAARRHRIRFESRPKLLVDLIECGILEIRQKSAREDIEGAVLALQKLLGMKEKGLEHHNGIVKLASNIATEMKVSRKNKTVVEAGAAVHDLGKIVTPDEILTKAGPLTEDEWVTMKKHTTNALELIALIPALAQVLPALRWHHEKYNGTGYPDGLAGNKIPLAARIISVADVATALGQDRPYRAAWPETEITDYIVDNSGTQFDPTVVTAFLKVRLNY